MGFMNGDDEEPMVQFQNPDVDMVSGLKYWGIGTYPFYTDPSSNTQTVATVAKVQVS
jgi:hypothetical protein